MQEQLARLEKSGDLQKIRTKPDAAHQISSIAPTRSQTATFSENSYELLLIEIQELRNANKQMTSAIELLKTNSSDENSNLRARLILLEASNSLLVTENLQLKNDLNDLPDKESLTILRKSVIEAEAKSVEIRELEEKLQKERKLLADDRSVFEADLVRLESLDAELQKLFVDQLNLSNSQDVLRLENIEFEVKKNELAIEQARLENLKIGLEDLQKRVGYLSGIENSLKSLKLKYDKLSKLSDSKKTRIRNLIDERNQARQNQLALEDNSKKISRDLKVALNKIATMPDSEVVIRSFETVRWLVSQFDDNYERLIPKKVLLLGDGPWPIDNFTELLQGLGFEVWHNGSSAKFEVVIVGREKWSAVHLESQIEARDGQSLKFYSQELFVLFLAMQADPLNVAPPESLMKFAEGHPAFEYLLNQQFPWPVSTFYDGPPDNVFEGFEDDSSSPLYKMGYSVAQQIGLSHLQRHKVLEETFCEKNLPWCNSNAYMDDWGDAKSRKRLRRIAWHLHMLSKRSRKNSRLEEASAKWESDLNWLRKFYKPIHRFSWPR